MVAHVVHHRPDLAPRRAAHDGVSDPERPLLDDEGRHRAAALVEVCLDGDAFSRTVGVGPQVQRGVRRQHDRGEELFDARSRHRGDVGEDRFAAVLLGNQAVLGELTAHLRRIGAFLVDLVDRDDNGNVRRLRVVERLDRLRHHAVVGGDDEDRDVRHLRASGAHCGERLVTRGVDERDEPVMVLELRMHLVGTDVLGDATGLARLHVGLADRVEELGLSVVDVAHDRDDRRPRREVGLVLVGVELEVEARQDLGVLLFGRDDHDVPAELGAEQRQRLLRRGLRCGHHLAELGEHDLDQRGGVGADLVGEVGEARTPGQANGLAVATWDLDATDRRRLHVVELLTPLLLRLATARGTTTRTASERALRRSAPTAAAGTAGSTTEATGPAGTTRAPGHTWATAGSAAAARTATEATAWAGAAPTGTPTLTGPAGETTGTARASTGAARPPAGSTRSRRHRARTGSHAGRAWRHAAGAGPDRSSTWPRRHRCRRPLTRREGVVAGTRGTGDRRTRGRWRDGRCGRFQRWSHRRHRRGHRLGGRRRLGDNRIGLGRRRSLLGRGLRRLLGGGGRAAVGVRGRRDLREGRVDLRDDRRLDGG